MYYIKKNIFNYFDGSGSGSGYPQIIEYRNGYSKPGYPKTTNPDPDPDTLNFPDIRIRPRANISCEFFIIIKEAHLLEHRYQDLDKRKPRVSGQ